MASEISRGLGNSHGGLKTACLNCRKQKVGCQTSSMASTCTRCRKMKLSCTYEPRYFRGQKRKEIMVQEAPLSKRPLISQSSSSSTGVLNSSLRRQSSPSGLARPFQSAAVSLLRSPAAALTLSYPSVASNTPSLLELISRPSYGTPVISRTIDGIKLDSETITELFSIYFTHFSPFLPILDATVHPNEYYYQCRLLFWSICAVASRRYPKDRTLTTVLPIKALDLAMKTLFKTQAESPVVESILLLLSWPPPPNAAYDEIPSVLSAALTQACMRIGLQIPHTSQDFARVKLSLSEAECERRFRLWTHSYILYQRSTCCAGNASLQFIATPSLENETRLSSLDSPLRLQSNLQDILTNASLALAENGLDLITGEQQHSFDILFKSYVDKLSFVEGLSAATSGLVRIYVVISQIMLHSFQFFRPADKHNSEELLALYTSACLLIAELESAQKFSGLVSYGTYWIFQGILLASCCLLRLLKTPLAGFDTSDGQRFFLKSLELMKNYSLTDNDHAARVSISLKALWNSDRVFKNVDGTWNSELRVRSRFGISVVFDVMWWSHEEFAGQNNPYPRKESVPTVAAIDATKEALPIGMDIMDSYVFGDTTSFASDFSMNDWWSSPVMATGFDIPTTSPMGRMASG